MSAELSAQYLSVDGRRIRYTVAGEGAPVVLLHGLGRSLEDWAEAQAGLAVRRTVYTVDLPGFGESERLSEPTDLPGLARAIGAFLDEVGERRPVRLIGNSMGGAVSLQFVALFPGRIEALVLVDSAGFGVEVTPALRVLALPGLGRLLLRPSRLAAHARARSVFHDRSLATAERVELALRLSQRPDAATVFMETARSIGSWRGVRPEWRRELIAAVAAQDLPILVIWGVKDKILPARHLEAAQRAFPHVRVQSFPDTGHVPQIERPREFLAAVEAFFDEVDETDVRRADA